MADLRALAGLGLDNPIWETSLGLTIIEKHVLEMALKRWLQSHQLSAGEQSGLNGGQENCEDSTPQSSRVGEGNSRVDRAKATPKALEYSAAPNITLTRSSPRLVEKSRSMRGGEEFRYAPGIPSDDSGRPGYIEGKFLVS